MVSSARALRDVLESRRRAVMAELRAYPPRVTGCDVQFNALLEARDRLSDVLRRLDALGDMTPDALAAAIDAAGFDPDTRADLRAVIGESASTARLSGQGRGETV